MSHGHLNASRSVQVQPASHESPADSDGQRSELKPYQLTPPPWRLPIQINLPTLGYPGIHPPHPGQHEDAITKTLLQWGFVAQMLVSTESFSAHQMIYKKLTDDSSFNVSSSALSALIEARRRFCEINNYDTKSVIKVPGRVTLNDQKRENWLRELADDSVPLLKLSKNVPHGFKGEKLLEMLVSRKIHPSRATWYIRLIGLNEINAQRNKNELSHIRYTLAFTSEVCQFLQKQLAEVTVPLQINLSSTTTSLISTSSRLAGMNVRSKPRSSTLSEPETRKHWVARWNQSCLLLKRLYFESLLDQPTLFKWLVDQLKSANLAQINFLLEIHHSVIDRFNLSSNLVRGFVEACLSQIRFIAKQTETLYLSKLERRLKLAVQSAFIFCPDNFVWPDLWIPNRLLLEEIILTNLSDRNRVGISSGQEFQTHKLREMLKGDFFSVNWRVSELIGDVGVGTGVVSNSFTRRAQLVEILDNYRDYHDCSKLYYSYFLNPSAAGHVIAPFKDKMEVLLSWATTLFRMSDKRVCLVPTALSYVKQDRKKNDDEFQNILVGWLEQIESIEGGDLLVRLFSELSRRNIFSYGAYVQRMVAKGDTESDILAGKASGLQALLSEWMPLASSKASRERSSSIKRSPGRDSSRNGLMAAIADITSAIASTDQARFILLISRRLDVSQPTSANRKILAEILPTALIQLVRELSFPNSPGSKNPNHPQMASALLTWAIQLLEACHAHATLFEIIQEIVQIELNRIETIRTDQRSQAELNLSFQPAFCYLQVICITALSHKEILEINGQLSDLISRLFAIYVHFRRRVGGTSPVVRGFARSLRNLVIEGNSLDGQILEVLDKDNHLVFEDVMSDFPPEEPLVPRTKEILHLIQSPSVEGISHLVFKYWEEHRSDMDWGPLLWNSFITAIKIHSQTELNDSLGKNLSEIAQPLCENKKLRRQTIRRFCEDLDMLYDDGLTGCLMGAGSSTYTPPDDDSTLGQTSASKPESEDEEHEEGEETSGEIKARKYLFLLNPRSLCPEIRCVLVELISHGLISFEAGLEKYVIQPLADDLPQLIESLCKENNQPSRGSRIKQAEEALRQVEEIYELAEEVLGDQYVDRCFQALNPSDKDFAATATAPSQARLQGPWSYATHGSLSLPAGHKEHIDQYVNVWRLNAERKLWFEQSNEGLAFCSRMLLSLLISIKTLSEFSTDANFASENPSQEPIGYVIEKILDVFENLRRLICQGISILRKLLPVQPALFLNPILEFTNKNDLGVIFHTKLIQSVDELLPYPRSAEVVNQKYPYLESVFKTACIFNHSARTRQFQLHIRLLMSNSPPEMPAHKEVSINVTNILGSLVEVMAKRLHLTDSKDAAPFFLDCLPAPVAEALIIKLSLYLGMSINKLLGSNQNDSGPEVSRIHHICRCITTLTHQLTIRTFQVNDDVTNKIVGGLGPLGCNASMESYMSYWQQLKSGLTSLNIRLTTHGTNVFSPKRIEYRIIRALLHSVQVVLWSLPGLISQLGTLKQTIAEIWIEISLRLQGDPTLQNQIMDTVGVLLFPTIPDDSILTATVGILRKRFRWLYLPILNLDDGANLVPSHRLKYLLGSSLRGSSITFQERLKDGAVKFVEEKPWEELEKMDLTGPGFISIDALKCQTLSQVEPIAESRQPPNKQKKPKRGSGEAEDAMTENMELSGEGGEDRLTKNMQTGFDEEEEEDGPMRGERDSFEHELITDGLSIMPLHFLRSLCPPESRLSGQPVITPADKKLQQTGQSPAQQQQQQQQAQIESCPVPDSSRLKKRKGLPLAQSPAEQACQSTSGPTLRSARSTRKKSSAVAAPATTSSSTASSKRAKKR